MRTALSLLLLLGCVPVFVFAQAPRGTTGVSVSPAILRLDLQHEPAEATLQYKNTTSVPIELSLRAQDFSELEDGWRVKFLDSKESANYHYSLSSWIHFETTSIILASGEERSVKVFIDKDRLLPGGHYASILAEIKQPEQTGQVGVRGILSSLLFVRGAASQAREEIHLSSWEPEQAYFFFPTRWLVRIKNSGNVETVPHGLIEIEDMWGRIVAKGIVNEESSITLPESIRRYEVPVHRLHSFLWPGIYKAQLMLHTGSTETNVSTSRLFISTGTPNASLLLMSGLITIVLVFFLRRKGFYHRVR